jgi:uncharacterized lipoprotein NlpE involved in copper resistance
MFKSVFTALLASLFLLGCANQRFNIAGDVSTTAPKMEDSQAFFVDGIGQKTTVDAAQTCGGAANVAGVAVEQTGINVLLRVVTLGIYTPLTARVYCK